MPIVDSRLKTMITQTTSPELGDMLLGAIEYLITINYPNTEQALETVVNSTLGENYTDPQFIETIVTMLRDVYQGLLDRLEVILDEDTPLKYIFLITQAITWLEDYDNHQDIVEICDKDITNEDKLLELITLTPLIQKDECDAYIESVDNYLIRNIKILHEHCTKFDLEPVADIRDRKMKIIAAIKAINEIVSCEDNLIIIGLSAHIPLNKPYGFYMDFFKPRLMAFTFEEKVLSLLLMAVISSDQYENLITAHTPYQEEIFNSLEEISRIQPLMGEYLTRYKELGI